MCSQRMLKRVVIMAFICFAPLPAFAQNADIIFQTINARMSYMEDVARYKAQNHLPIEDVPREQLVIQQATLSAAESGLESESVAAFFEALISGAKAIQYRCRADLLTQHQAQATRDLDSALRPDLIAIGKRLNSELADYFSHNTAIDPALWPQFYEAVQQKNLSLADKRAIFEALTKIRVQK
jgi:chorismate mutase